MVTGYLPALRVNSPAMVEKARVLAGVNGVCARAVVMLSIHGDVDCTPDLAYALARRAGSFAAVVLA